MEKRGNVWIWFGIICLIILFLIGSSQESEYEQAGNSFSTWVNTDPNDWTDTQREYYNNFRDWADNN